MQRDSDWLEAELAKSKGKFLFGNTVTSADSNIIFIVDFILATAGQAGEEVAHRLSGI